MHAENPDAQQSNTQKSALQEPKEQTPDKDVKYISEVENEKNYVEKDGDCYALGD